MIDPKKEYKTRDGRKVRILATDVRQTDSEVVVTATCEGGVEVVYQCDTDGRYYNSDKTPSHRDLIEVKPVFTRWMIVSEFSGYPTKEAAQRAYNPLLSVGDGAIVPVTFSPGDGFDIEEDK